MVGQSSGVPLMRFAHSPVPVAVQRLTGGSGPADPRAGGVHAHDFLTLHYVVDGRWARRVDGRLWEGTAGDVLVVAPGAVIGAADDAPPPTGDAYTVLFPAEAVDPDAAAPLASWLGHPLLAPFVGSHRGGAQRLTVPEADRPGWLDRLRALDTELTGRRDGYAEAARAHLTLLLVALGRLHDDVPAAAPDPLLAEVFTLIEDRFAEAISLRDVADAVGRTSGHLTTVVGRATGRTVQQWITERRMREARHLLAGTDLTVGEIGRRVGYRDAGYFVRRFRTTHGTSPAAWRRG